MKILQVGVGGLGSELAQLVTKAVEHDQIDSMIEYTIADDDIVEMNQISYQNYRVNEVGRKKVDALARRLKVFARGVGWLIPLADRIVGESQLKKYDIIILCVDNDVTRKLVVEYCFKNDKQFIDLRATGRNVIAIPKLTTLEDNMRFIDSKDKETYSCQTVKDKAEGNIQYGYLLAGAIGLQMLLNILRGYTNHAINMIV